MTRLQLLMRRRVLTAFGAAFMLLGWLCVSNPLSAQGFPDIEIVEAAKHGGISDARGAFLKGQSVNSRDRSGKPVLVIAVEHDNIAVLRFLLEEGANPDLTERRTSRSALITAAELGNAQAIRLLIKAKANVTLTDRQGETPLMKAVRADSLEAVKLLIEAGSDVNASDYAGHTALWHAEDGRQAKAAQMIKEAGGL